MKNEKRVHAGALAFFQLAQQRALALRFAQRLINHGRGLLGAAHGEKNAGGEHRVEKCERIADQNPARSAHPRRIVGIVAGDAHLADQLGVLRFGA